MVRHSQKIRNLQIKLDLDKNCDDFETYLELGKTLFDLAIYSQALEYFTTALEIYPESEEARFMKAYTELKKILYE